MNSNDGSAGSRLTISRISSAPIAPARTCCDSARMSGSKRRLKPICIVTPASSRARITSRARGISNESGFSQKTCLPARAAADGERRVGRRRRRDRHGLDRRIGENARGIALGALDAELFDPAAEVGGRIADDPEVGFGNGAGQELGVHPADAAGAEEGDRESSS